MPLPPWAGVLARGFRRDIIPINADPAFPGSVIRVALLGLAHHSQWRDRSGFSPEFPVGPKTGAQGQSTQGYRETDPGVKAQTEFENFQREPERGASYWTPASRPESTYGINLMDQPLWMTPR